MLRINMNCAAGLLIASATIFHMPIATAQTAIDNASLASADFRKHERTFGLVYTLPTEVNDLLSATIGGLLKEDLLKVGLATEAQMFNIPHVTVAYPQRRSHYAGKDASGATCSPRHA